MAAVYTLPGSTQGVHKPVPGNLAEIQGAILDKAIGRSLLTANPAGDLQVRLQQKALMLTHLARSDTDCD